MKRDQAIAKVSHALPLTVKERGRRGLHPQGAGALWRAYARCDGGIRLPPNPKCQQPGAGEHRPVDINALVDESLNLAYHGARAERQGFNITLERSFDPAAGDVDLFPQEITRALLNLISNGFYAASKRKAEANGGGYEPIVTATTNNLGDSRIRDNGTGIRPEVKEKLFSPFFTTKPAGEGTGLGLSISHDIIVKQHGGSIEVDTRPGEFTEFRLVAPPQ